MSKPNSGHFSGTSGHIKSSNNYVLDDDIISRRTAHLDKREHPIPHKIPSRKRMSEIDKLIDKRTATKEEYKLSRWAIRLNKRRRDARTIFWDQEKQRLLAGLPGTRPWTASQRNDILHDRTPKHKGKPIQAHHTYSVRKYPHLANRGEVIYPVTFHEHLYGWHGGNYKKSLPGRPIKQMRDF